MEDGSKAVEKELLFGKQRMGRRRAEENIKLKIDDVAVTCLRSRKTRNVDSKIIRYECKKCIGW